MLAEAGPRGPIIFSHANGFPAGTYRVLFERWRAAGHAVHAVDKFGHQSDYPVTGGWPHLVDELVHFAEREVGEPAWFVGHSLGGFLGVMAAWQRPAHALGVVLLDSPIIDGWRAPTLQLAQATGLFRRYPASVASQRRRQHWPSGEAAHEHFAGKPAFARWDPRVLRDYIAAGTEAREDGSRRLAFRREVEGAIYLTLPHHIARRLRARPLSCPLAFIGGRASVEVRQVGITATERFARGRVRWIDGSHLFPMERPDESAQVVLDCLGEFAAGAAATPAAPASPSPEDRSI